MGRLNELTGEREESEDVNYVLMACQKGFVKEWAFLVMGIAVIKTASYGFSSVDPHISSCYSRLSPEIINPKLSNGARLLVAMMEKKTESKIVFYRRNKRFVLLSHSPSDFL